MRNTAIHSGEVYHIFNRGVDKRVIFPNRSFYERFVNMLKHYLVFESRYSIVLQARRDNEDITSLARKWPEPLVKLLSYCLLPNHFHLQIKQLVENGITILMHRLGTGYTNYFNLRNERAGRLFQGPFKSFRVESEGQFLCLNRYIHANPIAAGLADREGLSSWEWSSLPEYLGQQKDEVMCDTKEILGYFKDKDDYLDFVLSDFKEPERHSLEGLSIDDDFGWFEELREKKRKVKQDAVRRLRRA